jgi:septum formation protein
LSGPHLILASASPRRRDLLTAAGIEFEIVPPDVDEIRTGDPAEAVLANARAKARAVAEGSRADALVLGVDTDVALDGRLLGKAADEAGARERLTALSGRTHEVLSGVALIASQEELTALEVSKVTFATLASPAIERYVASGEWRDRAGAYAVQGLGSMLVERVEGDLSNVIGLPLRRLFELLGSVPEKPNSEVHP